jgi:thiamine transport system permease protein
LRPLEWSLLYKRIPLWLRALTLLVVLSYVIPPILLTIYLPGAPTSILHRINLPWILEWTLFQAVVSATVAAVIGAPIGIAAAYYGSKVARSYRILGLPVFMAPSVSVVLGFRWLAQSTGIEAFAKAPAGIILVHSYYNIPLAAVLAYSSVTGIIGELIEYVESIGIRGIRLWRTLLLPSALPGLASAWLLAFTYSFMGLAAPLMTEGAAYRYYTLEAWIYTIFSGFPNYLRVAAALSVGQASLLAIVVVAILKASESRPRAPLEGLFTKPKYRSITYFLLEAYSLIVLVYLYLPLTGVFLESITGSSGFTFLAYERLIHGNVPLPPGASFARALVNSLAYAGLTVLLAVFLSLPIALSKGVEQRLAGLAPLLFSPVTVGLALYLEVYRVLATVIGGTLAVVLLVALSHTSAAMPLASRAIDQALSRVPQETMQFLAQLRLRGTQLLYHLLSIGRPGVASAALLSAAASLGEFGATLVITTPSTWSLGVLTYNLYSAGRFLPEASASASILLGISILVSTMLSNKIKEWF